MFSWEAFKLSKLRELKRCDDAGKTDKRMMQLVRKINSVENLVTTSSCAGRIVLLEYNLNEGKKTANFYKKWHREVKAKEIKSAIMNYSKKKPLWFKTEPFILHVVAKNLDSALRFLTIVRSVGVKRGGIQAIGKNKVIIEIQGNGQMIIPLWAVKGEWIKITDIANNILRRNFIVLEKIVKFSTE